MTNKDAIFVLKKEFDGIPSDIDKSALEKAVDLAIKALEDKDFFEFIVNHMNPNEFQNYWNMYYHTIDEKVCGGNENIGCPFCSADIRRK
jgi:hypothetical protein